MGLFYVRVEVILWVSSTVVIRHLFILVQRFSSYVQKNNSNIQSTQFQCWNELTSGVDMFEKLPFGFTQTGILYF